MKTIMIVAWTLYATWIIKSNVIFHFQKWLFILHLHFLILLAGIDGEDLRALISHTFDLVDVEGHQGNVQFSIKPHLKQAMTHFEQQNIKLEKAIETYSFYLDLMISCLVS